MTQQNQNSSPDISKWLIILTMLGGAGGGFSAFIGQLEPTQIIILALAGALFGGLLSFVLRIVSALINRHENRLVDLLDSAIQDFFALTKPHARRYNRHLQRLYGSYNMAINLENAPALQLKDVYVELQMNQDQLGMNPVPTLREMGSKPATIWAYLNAVQNLALVGAPGSGKTTLLEHVTLILAGKARGRKAVNAPKRIPVLIKLREHSKAFDALDTLKLPDLIMDTLKAMKQAEQPPRLWFERQLEAGRCIVMFDGLDELGQASRKEVVHWIDQQMNVQYPQCKFIVTSRPAGFSNSSLKAQAVFTLLPLTHTQVRMFIQNWYVQTELRRNQAQKDRAVPEMRAEEGTQKLLAVLEQRPAIAELTVNPLLLTMIVSLHYYKRASLPERRAELYREICKLFLGELDEQRGIAVVVSADQKQTVLEPLAYAMLCGENGVPKLSMNKDEVLQQIAEPLALLPDISGEVFLEQFKTRTPLLVEREADEYEFAHKTFAEYLTAVHIKEQGLEAELLQRLDDDNWHEVIRLYCALPKVNATPIIVACIEQELLPTERLVLAVQCEQDAQVEPATRARLRTIVDESLDSDDDARRTVGARVLLRRRQIEGFRRLDDRTQIDTTLVTHGEYRLFLEEMQQQQGRYFQPDHWDLATFTHPPAKTPMLGAAPQEAQAFCGWMTANDPTWRYRIPHISEGTGIRSPYWVETEQGAIYIEGGETRRVVGMSEGLILLVLGYSRAFAIDRSRASDLARDLARDLASDRARDLASDLVRDLTGTLDRSRASDLARDVVRDLARDVVRDLAGTLARARALPITRDHARALARTRDLARALALGHAHNLIGYDIRIVFVELWGISVLLSAFGNDSIFVNDHTQWLKDAVGDIPGAWHQYLNALRHAVTQASKELHRKVDNFNLIDQVRKREEYQTLQQELEKIDALRFRLDLWEARVNGVQEPVEGLLLVRERKT